MNLLKQAFLGICVSLFIIVASERGTELRRVGACLFVSTLVGMFVAPIIENHT